MAAFILGSVIFFGTVVIFSVLSMSVPWFRRSYEREKWEKETPAQRFFRMFIPGVIAYLVLLFLYTTGGI